jgi:hypothetical protein
MNRTLLALALASLSPAAFAQTDAADASAEAAAKGFDSAGEFFDWTMTYYRDPAPERLPAAVDFLHERNVFDEHPDAYWPLTMFFGGAYATDEDAARAAMDQALASDDPYLQTFVISSLWAGSAGHCREQIRRAEGRFDRERMSGLVEWVKENEAFLESGDPVSESVHLDMLWGRFSATGEARAVSLVIDALGGYDHNDERLELATAAQWSLDSQARRHPEVLRVMRERAQREENATIREALEEIIEGVEAD